MLRLPLLKLLKLLKLLRFPQLKLLKLLLPRLPLLKPLKLLRLPLLKLLKLLKLQRLPLLKLLKLLLPRLPLLTLLKLLKPQRLQEQQRPLLPVLLPHVVMCGVGARRWETSRESCLEQPVPKPPCGAALEAEEASGATPAEELTVLGEGCCLTGGLPNR